MGAILFCKEYNVRKLSRNQRVDLELTKYLNFAVFKFEIAIQFDNEHNFNTEIDSFTDFSVLKILENESFRVAAKLKKYWDLNLPEITLLLKITSFDKIYPSNSLYDNAIRVAKFPTKCLDMFQTELSISNKNLESGRFCYTESLKFRKVDLNNSIHLHHTFINHFDIKKDPKI